MKRFVFLPVLLVLLVFSLFVAGCGDDNASFVTPDLDSPSLVLIVAGNDGDGTSVISPDGQIYAEETIQEAIKVVAKNGQDFETRIFEQPVLDRPTI